MIKIVTWNVNSVIARLSHVELMANSTRPDIILLQEIKADEIKFPKEQLEDFGYNCVFSGMKAYNGVAILSKLPLEDVQTTFCSPNIDQHFQNYGITPKPMLESRYIEATAIYDGGAIKVASIYVPNGGVNAAEADLDLNVYETERFKFKEAFYTDMTCHFKTLMAENICFFGGDYNIAREEIDVHSPVSCSKYIGFLPKERAIIKKFLEDTNLCDTFRHKYPNENGFSWWDYRRAGFSSDRGMRIDNILTNAKDTIEDCVVLKSYRGLERPSDHAPVMCSANII